MILFLFKRKKKFKITKEEYGREYLSQLLLNVGSDSANLFEQLGREIDLNDYLCYIQYLLFIVQKNLEGKYSAKDTTIIVNATIHGFINKIPGVKSESKEEFERDFKNAYIDLVEFMGENSDISNKETLHKLTNCFLEVCDFQNDAINHYNVFLRFSAFIISYTSAIFTDDLIVY